MSSETEPKLYPIFTRICLRCKRPVNGYGFYTLYGYIVVGENGSSDESDATASAHPPKKIHGSGDAVHHRCPEQDAQRVVPHDSGEVGVSEYARHMRNVSPGIDYNARTGRYAARVGKKRLGTHATQELAEQARKDYLDSTHETPHRRFRNKRERREEKRNVPTR